jgi:cell division protein FtsI/penicillin-binding protein 2
VEIDRRISDTAAAAIEELDHDGFSLYRTQWRYYPGGSMAARSIGFVGYSDPDATELRGTYGLERYYDEVLVRDDTTHSVNFFAELFSNLGDLVYERTPEQRGDVVTTLEPTVARMLDSVLARTNEEFESELTGGIVMDPETGAIYALNAVPGFDLNDRSDATIEQFQNPLVENVYRGGGA